MFPMRKPGNPPFVCSMYFFDLDVFNCLNIHVPTRRKTTVGVSMKKSKTTFNFQKLKN